MEVVAVRIKKKDGSSFIKVLVNSEQSPMSIIKNEQWLEHNGKKYRFGFNLSEEFFEQIRIVEVEELRKEKPTSREELEQMIREILKKELRKIVNEIREEEKKGEWRG